MSALLPTLLVYATQLLAGLLLLSAVDPRRHRRADERLSRALLLGPAALAIQMLLMDAIGLRFALTSVLLPWWAAGALVLANTLRRGAATRGTSAGAPPHARAGVGASADPPANSGAAGRSNVLRHATLGLAGLLFVVALAQGLQLPVCTSDAMHNFALMARVFETHGHIATEALADLQVVGHGDYPPLVPLNEAVIFLAAGDARAFAIKPFFALADLALLLLVIEACFRTLPRTRAACLAAFVLLTPLIGVQAIEGYADLRLAATMLLLALQAGELWRTPTARAALLFGLCAASCALTKFEGLAVALAVAPLPLLVAALAGRRGKGLRWPAALGACALMLALSLAWPAHLATRTSSDAPLAGAAWHDTERAVERWPGAFTGLLGLTLHIDRDGRLTPGMLWPVLGVLVAGGLMLSRRRRSVALWLLVFGAQFLLYVTVLALSPSDLTWHVGTAGPRLLLHALPWALLAAITALAPAQES